VIASKVLKELEVTAESFGLLAMMLLSLSKEIQEPFANVELITRCRISLLLPGWIQKMRLPGLLTTLGR
jgi:hypothetical protein